MGEYDKNAWGLGNASESQLDAPRGDWGSILSQRKIEKIDPVKDIGDFAAKSDAAVKEANLQERKTWGKQREEGLKFTDPVKNEAPPLLPADRKGKLNKNIEAEEFVSVHDWKITSTENGWKVAGGFVYYVNENISEIINETTVLGEKGVIYLHITRDPSSRVVTATTVELLEDYTQSTEHDQYFELGTVGGAPLIIQKHYTPIRVFEDLVAVNGELKLVNLAIFGDNFYSLPV